MICLLLSIHAAQETVNKTLGIIAAVVVLLILIVLLVTKVIIPKIKNKKLQKIMQEKREKEQELNKIWRANYQKINSALKTVFYLGLVDSWKNIQDMLAYQVKDTCPYCNGKLVEGKNDWENTTSLQYSPTGQIVNTKSGFAHLWVGEDRLDGGYIWTTSKVCEHCHRTLFKGRDSCASKFNSEKFEDYWIYSESYSFEGIKWRNSDIEKALGKELCDYIDLNGHLHHAMLTQSSSRERKYS